MAANGGHSSARGQSLINIHAQDEPYFPKYYRTLRTVLLCHGKTQLREQFAYL